jgi:hypothetical protein
MTDVRQLRRALVVRVLEGDGTASHIHRHAAFDNADPSVPTGTLLDKVVHRANEVIDEDIVAVRASGLSEDQIFEIVVCVAIGQAVRQHDTALAALDSALGKK